MEGARTHPAFRSQQSLEMLSTSITFGLTAFEGKEGLCRSYDKIKRHDFMIPDFGQEEFGLGDSSVACFDFALAVNLISLSPSQLALIVRIGFHS